MKTSLAIVALPFLSSLSYPRVLRWRRDKA